MHAYPTTARALLAGHQPGDVRIVRDILGRLGIDRVDAVADGKGALGAMAAHAPDILVLDWDIGAAGTDTLVAAARKAGEGRARIVVTMTAPTRTKIEAAKALKIDSIVSKPFSPRAFMDRLPRAPEAGVGRSA